MIVQDLITVLDKLAPFSLAAEWDNVGLMLGSPGQEMTGILVGLDPTEELFDEAVELGLNTIVTHHPLIFQGLKSIRTDQPAGRLIKKGLLNDLAVIACHTNLDVVEDGVSDRLANILGLKQLKPLSLIGEEKTRGFGRLGVFDEPLDSEIFMARLRERIGISVLPMAGKPPEKISKVAVCGGSGSDLSEAAFLAGADLYITAEIKHAVARWAEANHFCIVDGSHFATENIVVPGLTARLKEFFVDQKTVFRIEAATRQKNPLNFIY